MRQGTPTSSTRAGLTDGPHNVQPAVVDPAGNETRGVAFMVRVDNTAPPAPTGLVLSGGGTSSAFDASWTVPAADGASPYVGSVWQACAGGSCTSGTGALASASGALPVGTSTVKVWLVDAAGNASQSTAASSTITSIPLGGGGGGGGGGGSAKPAAPAAPDSPIGPPPIAPIPTPVPTPSVPTAPPAPRARPVLRLKTAVLDARTGRLILRGSTHRNATGTITVTITTHGHRKTLRVRIHGGRYSARTTVPRGTRAARVTVRYTGSAAIRPGRATRMVSAR